MSIVPNVGVPQDMSQKKNKDFVDAKHIYFLLVRLGRIGAGSLWFLSRVIKRRHSNYIIPSSIFPHDAYVTKEYRTYPGHIIIIL